MTFLVIPLVLAAAMAIAGGARAQQQNSSTAATMVGPPTQTLQNADRILYRVAPQDTNPQLHRYLRNHFILVERTTLPTAPMLLFMAGTSGGPADYMPFLIAGSKAGYRVVGLEYNDEPAVAQICQSRPDATCSGLFREKRIFGNEVFRDIDDTPEESIVNRLVKLVQFMDAQHPGDGWGNYLVNQQPNWSRIAVSGHSQGAGMAAFIAKKYLVARVVLLSSPWDHYGQFGQLAPWIKDSSITPPELWYGAYHKHEHEADTLKRSYKALGVPENHIRIFTLDPNLSLLTGKPDPKEDYFHSGEITTLTPRKPDGTPAYADDWAFLLGAAK
ncbi:MAG TPA: hypothetical protein VN777_05710 [Terriglobales bacterium]|nr:hypothetical protein [Terriglobales bacterium]